MTRRRQYAPHFLGRDGPQGRSGALGERALPNSSKKVRAESRCRTSRLWIDPMDPSERDKYQAAIHGDREAFELIIRTHSPTLLAITYSVLQRRAEAQAGAPDPL